MRLGVQRLTNRLRTTADSLSSWVVGSVPWHRHWYEVRVVDVHEAVTTAAATLAPATARMPLKDWATRNAFLAILCLRWVAFTDQEIIDVAVTVRFCAVVVQRRTAVRAFRQFTPFPLRGHDA